MSIKIRNFVLSFVFFSCCLTLPTFAANVVTQFEHYSVDDGLPQLSAVSSYQDSLGFLWVGTQQGLARYDGYNFKVYLGIEDDIHTLSGNYITAIVEDHHGSLWVGTLNGLNRINLKSEKITRYVPNEAQHASMSNESIYSLAVDKEGHVWVGTNDNGIYSLDAQTNDITHYKYDPNKVNNLTKGAISSIAADNEGFIWIGTDGGGLNRLDLETKKFKHFQFDANDPKSISHNRIRNIVINKNNNIWVGTYGGGINLLETKTNSFTRFIHSADDPHSLSHDNAALITEDEKGNIWIGTMGAGLNKYNPMNNNFIRYKTNPLNPDSLSSDDIMSLSTDNQGNLWVGTYNNGLNRLNLNAENFGHHNANISKTNTISDNNIQALIQDKQGYMWFGTDNGGLNRYNPTKDEYEIYQSQSSALSNNDITSIVEGNSGNIWAGTWGGGLNKLNVNTNKFEHYNHNINDSNSISSDEIFTIAKDKVGSLWISTKRGGVDSFDIQTEKFKHFRHEANNTNTLNSNRVISIFADQHGEIWFGTDKGLSRFNPSTKSFTHYFHDVNNEATLSNNVITAIVENKSGNLWLGTNKGLDFYNRSTNNFERFGLAEGLNNNRIRAIIEDNSGALWITTDVGLSFFDPKTKTFTNFHKADGLQSEEFNDRAAFKSHNGEIYVGGFNGYNRFSPENISITNLPKPVTLTDFLILNTSVSIVDAASKISTTQSRFYLENAIHSTPSIILTHKEYLISLEFSSLDLIHAQKRQYAYFLEGFDKDWITTTNNKRFATYTNLPDGKYTFRVKSRLSGGLWGDAGNPLTIKVLPPPWRTWWAYTIYTLLFMTLILAFARAQRKKVQYERKINEQLEHKVVERTKELQEAYSQLEELSLTDQLTGLKNRRFLENNIDNDIAIVNRNYQSWCEGEIADRPEASSHIFFIIDLDHFKKVNDIYGHSAGDAVLIQIKGLLEQVFRETDYLVRWGGEEFLVIARFCDPNKAPNLAERLREGIEHYDFDIGEGKVLNKTCSIGFACYPFLQQQPKALKWTQVLDIADHCLYAAKKSSRNAWVGVNSTDTCSMDDLFARTIEQTSSLIQGNELQMLTSILDKDEVNW